MTRKNIISLAIVVVFGLIIQTGLLAMDHGKSTPADTAEEFARAYYRLDPTLAQWMEGTTSTSCGKCAGGNESAAGDKADCGKNSGNCAKADSTDEPANCPKAASGHDAVNCPKAVSGDESAASANTASGCESADCTKTVCRKKLARRINAAVENYLYEAKRDAAERGFKDNFTKYTLSHVETRTEYLDETTALVHLTARRRLSINPLYAYVARLFRIGDTYEVDESIRLKLKDGRWRVCESSLLS